MINAHIQDGVAVTKFLYWIKNSNIKNLDEIKVEKKLESFRKLSKNFLYPSFNTIAGSGPNGAIIHYRSNKKLVNLSIPDKFIFENLGREMLLDKNGLSAQNILKKLKKNIN